MGSSARKEMKTAEELVTHLKSRGVTFQRISEVDAVAFLKRKNNYFRVAAFRKLFQKRVGGREDGRYISLDFDDLVQLSYVDQDLRSLLRAMALDVEHYEKVSILDRIAEDGREDGYSIVRDYRGSLNGQRLSHFDAELTARSRDTYSGAVIGKYSDEMPVWVLLEVVSFGTFIDFCRFCSGRWDDEELLDLHYMMKKAKSVRNAASHGACILNGFGDVDNGASSTPRTVRNALGATGLSKQVRRRWLGNPRMRDIVTLVYLCSARVPEGVAKDGAKAALISFFDGTAKRLSSIPPNNPAVAGLTFAKSLTEAFSLV